MQKILLITGASEGIGAATALTAARRGYTVCINYRRNRAGAEQVRNSIRAEGGQAFVFQGDVSDEAQVLRLFESIDREVGTLYGLVNNAAIIEPQQLVRDMSAERVRHVFDVNVVGTFLCAREAVRRMSEAGAGCIVNVSSMAAKYGSAFEYVDYAASKAAVDTLTIGLAQEVAAQNIRVNAVRPGIIHTDIHRKAGEPGRVERLRERVPLKRGGQPDEIAHAILWLLSDEASYVTGTLMDVSGGR